MPNVSKHDSEEKGKSHHVETSGIYFFVSWNTISFNNCLKRCSELIKLIESRSLQRVVANRVDLGYSVSSSTLYVINQCLLFLIGHPD